MVFSNHVVWPFNKKTRTVEDTVQRIIDIASATQQRLMKDPQNTRAILPLLKIIQKLDLEQFNLIKKEPGSERLMKEARDIYALSTQAIEDIEEYQSFEKSINRIVAAEKLLPEHLAEETPFLPSKLRKKVLRYSAKEAIRNRVLFRGLSEGDYDRIMHANQPLFARIPSAPPNTRELVIKHIIDPTNNDTPFISLTPDVKRAATFGKIIAVDMRKLKGEILAPENVRQLTAGDTRVLKFVKKNEEYLLAPAKNKLACIPPDAVIR